MLLVIACLGAAAALTTVRSKIENVPVVDIGSSLTPATEITEPRNFLIIGTDSAARIDPDDIITEGREQLGTLADVIMILRVDPRDGSAKLLSIPRDSRVSVAPDGGMARINTAINGVDGPQNLVQTIKRNFGISIDNYVEIDFQAFRDLVEVLGGVPVYFTTPVRDRQTALIVEQSGCVMLDPGQALAYARSRHFEYKVDGEWETDGSGDLGRITRQQDFIKRALRRASDKGVRNPSTAVGVVNAAAGAVTLDKTLDVGTILTLVSEFQSFNPDSLASNQIPTVYAPLGGVAYQDVDWEAAEAMVEPFRGVDPGAPLQPNNVIVDVIGSGSGEEELAGIVTQLDTATFDAEVIDSRSSSDITTITYGPNGREAAVLLAAQLQVVPDFDLDEEIAGYRVELEIGDDFGGVRDQAIPVEQIPAELLPPPTSTTEAPATPVLPEEPGSDPVIEAPTSTTSTTLPGVVPTDPTKAATCR